MPASLHLISSMATRQLLAELATTYERAHGAIVRLEAVGGVDAARRVQAGEAFDVVVLAARAIDELAAAGHVLAGSRVDLVHSGVAVAVPANAPLPPIATEAQLRAAVLSAHRVGYSTGPSGTALMALFERWGIAAQIRERLVQAPAGTPVAQLVARGDVSLGFQQLSEMLHVEGIRIVGPLPPEVQIITTFSAGIASTCRDSAQAKHLIDHLAAADTAIIKQRQGMEPA